MMAAPSEHLPFLSSDIFTYSVTIPYGHLCSAWGVYAPIGHPLTRHLRLLADNTASGHFAQEGDFLPTHEPQRIVYHPSGLMMALYALVGHCPLREKEERMHCFCGGRHGIDKASKSKGVHAPSSQGNCYAVRHAAHTHSFLIHCTDRHGFTHYLAKLGSFTHYERRNYSHRITLLFGEKNVTIRVERLRFSKSSGSQ